MQTFRHWRPCVRMKPCSHSRSCVYYTQHNLFCLLPVKHKQLKGRRQRNLRLYVFGGLCIDLCIALEFEGHPPISVDSHGIDNGQPELFVKFGKRVQLLHLKHECANGIPWACRAFFILRSSSTRVLAFSYRATKPLYRALYSAWFCAVCEFSAMQRFVSSVTTSISSSRDWISSSTPV